MILDTDHFSAFMRSTAEGEARRKRLHGGRSGACITIVTAEEQCRGWLARLNASRSRRDRLLNYERYSRLLSELRNWRILPWTGAAEDILAQLQSRRIRIGTMDLRIAAITMANDATLLSRNLRDFQRVPGLKVENCWMRDRRPRP